MYKSIFPMSFWGAVTAAALSAGASILGSGLSSSGQSSANALQVQEAERNREWQEEMSNTAHQREVKDLRKAGLNPILSATGGKGASTGSPVMPQTKNKYEKLADMMNSAKILSDINLVRELAKTERTKQTSAKGTAQWQAGHAYDQLIKDFRKARKTNRGKQNKGNPWNLPKLTLTDDAFGG